MAYIPPRRRNNVDDPNTADAAAGNVGQDSLRPDSENPSGSLDAASMRKEAHANNTRNEPTGQGTRFDDINAVSGIQGSTPGNIGTAQEPTLTDNSDIGDLQDAAARKYLEGNMDDTAAEQANIQAQMDRTLGKQINDQRASMGHAGFGGSGALAGIEGDLRSQAALDAENQMFGVREHEQQQQFNEQMGANSAANANDEQKQRSAAAQAKIDELTAETSNQTGAEGLPVDKNGKITSFADDKARQDYTAHQQSITTNYADGQNNKVPGQASQPYLVTHAVMNDLQDAGYEMKPVTQPNAAGDQLFVDQDGKYWFIRGGT